MHWTEKVQRWRTDERRSEMLLAKAANINYTTLHNAVSNAADMSGYRMLCLARAMNVDLEWLVDPAADWPPVIRSAVYQPEAEAIPEPEPLADRPDVQQVAKLLADLLATAQQPQKPAGPGKRKSRRGR